VAYMKLNWRYCDSFEIELTVIMWCNRATFKYCVQMFDLGWANFYFEFWKHIVVWKSWSHEFHYFASILIFILNLKYSLMITWMQKFNGAFDIQENGIDNKMVIGWVASQKAFGNNLRPPILPFSVWK
jgi:hypothetical protein